ncbi:MAG: hypothetical protein JWN57_1015 [Frankiales bacterium]|jgi:hypothetical protein|nr:hypothetical protein [Frankiales bacterium]
MKRLCEDCGARAGYALSSTREEAVWPPDQVETYACDDHRLDVTESLLNRHGNVTIVEIMG